MRRHMQHGEGGDRAGPSLGPPCGDNRQTHLGGRGPPGCSGERDRWLPLGSVDSNAPTRISRVSSASTHLSVYASHSERILIYADSACSTAGFNRTSLSTPSPPRHLTRQMERSPSRSKSVRKHVIVIMNIIVVVNNAEITSQQRDQRDRELDHRRDHDRNSPQLLHPTRQDRAIPQ